MFIAAIGGLSSRRGRGGGIFTPPPDLPGYNLAEKLEAIRALSGFSGLATPTAPVDSGNGGTVTNMSQLTDATNTNGGVFTVNAGSYSGNITLNGLDQKFKFQSGFQLAAGSGKVITIGVNARRIHLEGLGANPSNAEFLGSFSVTFPGGATDVKFKNLKISGYNISGDSNSSGLALPVQRFLFERCDLSSYQYCLYNNGCTDLILCNSRVEGFVGVATAQAVLRIVKSIRVVCIDNLMRHQTHHSVRVHQSGGVVSDLVYAARNQLESSSFGGGFMMNSQIAANPQCDRCWMVDNTFYATSGMNAVEAAGATTFVNTGNTFPGGGTGPAWSHQ